MNFLIILYLFSFTQAKSHLAEDERILGKRVPNLDKNGIIGTSKISTIFKDYDFQAKDSNELQSNCFECVLAGGDYNEKDK